MHLDLKRRYWRRHFWAKGYCVSTIGLDEDEIRQYVRYHLHKDKKTDQLKLWNKYQGPFRSIIKPSLLGVVIDFLTEQLIFYGRYFFDLLIVYSR